MSEMSDVMLKALIPVIKKLFDKKCDEYERDGRYKILKIYENHGLILLGFCVYHDEDGSNNRWVDEVHYTGHNKYISVRFWKWINKEKKTLKCTVLQCNTKMIDFYKRIGFEILEENQGNYVMQRSI